MSGDWTKSESTSPSICPWTTYRHAKKYATGFYMAYYEKGMVCISDYALQLILPP